MKNYIKALTLLWVATITVTSSISVSAGDRLGIKSAVARVGAINYKIQPQLVGDVKLRAEDNRLAAIARPDSAFKEAVRSTQLRVDYSSTGLHERRLQGYSERELNKKLGLLARSNLLTIRDPYRADGGGKILNSKWPKWRTPPEKTRTARWSNWAKPPVPKAREAKGSWGHGGWWPWRAGKSQSHLDRQRVSATVRSDRKALRKIEAAQLDRAGARFEITIREGQIARRERFPEAVYPTIKDERNSRRGSALRVVNLKHSVYVEADA